MPQMIGRWCLLVTFAFIALQLFFALRIVGMLVIDPQSTAFERSEAVRVLNLAYKPFTWQQVWVPYEHISTNLKRSVIASEDSDFSHHDGVEWHAIEKALRRNAKAQGRAVKHSRNGKVKIAKVIGASTITQQLVKNLFLSSERTYLRKGQEFVLTFLIEAVLPKQRILEIYLNSAEWGEGVFGAEAAAQRYFRKPAAQLSSYEAARLAVMLPGPKLYEKMPDSIYLNKRIQTILARMADAELP